MKITTLIENESIDTALTSEHGLSIYVEIDGKSFLFDSGQTGAFADNARILGKDLNQIQTVILSHSHYDHGGGIPRLLQLHLAPMNFIVGKTFFVPKFKTLPEGHAKFLGCAFTRESLEQSGHSVLDVEKKYSITKHLSAFRGFEKTNDYETIPVKFKIQPKKNLRADTFKDETVLVAETTKGLIVIVGCSHIGLVNILTTIQKEYQAPIYATVGGSHLVDANESRINQTIEALEKLGIQKYYLSHCTGPLATKILKQKLGDKFIGNHTGNVIEF